MKKLFFAAAMLFAFAAQGQTIDQANYYGVDFSRAQAYGADDPGEKFKDAFARINELTIAEWSKYNPGRYLDTDIDVQDITPTIAANEGIDPSKINTRTSSVRKEAFTPQQIGEVVRAYKIAETEGTGLVIVARLLDKAAGKGYFSAVYFDIATRQVLLQIDMKGSVGGFGLRNYWAGSLYDALKRAR